MKWYAKPNDLIGGWSIMNVDKLPSQCDYRKNELEIGSFLNEGDAHLIVWLYNGHQDQA